MIFVNIISDLQHNYIKKKNQNLQIKLQQNYKHVY